MAGNCPFVIPKQKTRSLIIPSDLHTKSIFKGELQVSDFEKNSWSGAYTDLHLLDVNFNDLNV